MNIPKVFCENCRNNVGYTEISVPMVGTIKEKEYHYIGKEAFCAKCGSLIFVPALSDLNLQALYDAYRKENDIISVDKICEIPKNIPLESVPSLCSSDGENKLFLDMQMVMYQQNSILIFLHVSITNRRSIRNYWRQIRQI